MIGSIIGDIAGSKYELDEFKDSRKDIINLERRLRILDKSVNLFDTECLLTDDSILTIAIMDSILSKIPFELKLREYINKYKDINKEAINHFEKPFSPGTIKWANSPIGTIGTSKGNGSAMRASSIGYFYDSLEEVLEQARLSTIPSHNSLEAITGASAIASTIFLTRNKNTRHEIKQYVETKFKYNLNFDLRELQENNRFEMTCDNTVPQAIFVFLNSIDFEDSIRKAISIGGDTDTIACMVGGMSEAKFGVPYNLKKIAYTYLDDNMKSVLDRIYKEIEGKREYDYGR